MSDENSTAAAVLANIRPVIARLDTPRSADDVAADIIEIWAGVEAALLKMLGGSEAEGLGLVPHAYQRGLITLEETRPLFQIFSVRERCDDVSYKPSADDIAAVKKAFSELDAQKNAPLRNSVSQPRSLSSWVKLAFYYVKFGFVFVVLFLYCGTGLWMMQDDPPPARWYLLLVVLLAIVGMIREGLKEENRP